MDPITLAAIGAALGAAKSEFVDRPQEKKARELAAQTQRWSPWTGLQAGPVKNADLLGNVMQGGFTGASLGQGKQANTAATVDPSAVAGGAGAYNAGVQYPTGYTAPRANKGSWAMMRP